MKHKMLLGMILLLKSLTCLGMYDTDHVDKLEVEFANEEIAFLVMKFSGQELTLLKNNRELLKKYPRIIEVITNLTKGRQLLKELHYNKRCLTFEYKKKQKNKKEIEELLRERIPYIERVHGFIDDISSGKQITIYQAKVKNKLEKEKNKREQEEAIQRALFPKRREMEDECCIIL